MTIKLDGLAIKAPHGFTETVIKKAYEDSIVGKLGNRQLVTLAGAEVPIVDGGFEVGFTAEGEAKPVGDIKFSAKTIKPVTLAGILLVSRQLAKSNPANLMQSIQAEMTEAITRGIDFATLYGKSPVGGGKIPGTDSVNATTNRVELDLAKPLSAQLLAGYKLAAASDDSGDPNGWAFDSRLKADVAIAAQASKNSPELPNLADLSAVVAGLPAVYSRVVGGRVGALEDTKVRGFIGDWNRVIWGMASDIELTRSDQTAVNVGGTMISTFQNNLIAFRIEVQAGWAIVDPNVFVAFDDKA